MRIFIAADMEGISGVERVHDVMLGLDGYETFRGVMAGDVNATIEGACRAGASRITVADGHALQTNIRPTDLDTRAELKSGAAELVQLKGLASDVKGAFLVGFHAKSGTVDGVLSHSFLSSFLDIRLNGRSVGEAELAAWVLAARGIPVALLSGDDTTIAQTRPVLGDAVEYVEVKRARSRTSADHPPLADTRRRLRQGAERAVARLRSGLQPIPPIEGEAELEIDLALAPNEGMPDMLGRNARFADRADAGAVSDLEFVRSLEPLDSPRPGTIRLTGDVVDLYAAIGRLAGRLMLRNLDWLLNEVAPRSAYGRDLTPWREPRRATAGR